MTVEYIARFSGLCLSFLAMTILEIATSFYYVCVCLDAAGGEGDLVWYFLDDFHISHIEALVDCQ